jgi:hypothetical protein
MVEDTTKKLKLKLNLPPTKLPPLNTTVVKADSGATKHYFKSEHQHILQQLQATHIPATVQLPNNETITSSAIGYLPSTSNNLSATATKVHVFPDLQSSSLLSLGQLCDDNCEIYLTADSPLDQT